MSDDETPFPEHLRMPPTPVLETRRLILRNIPVFPMTLLAPHQL